MRFLRECKSWYIWKHKFELLLLVLVITSVYSIMALTTHLTSSEVVESEQVIEAVALPDCYKLVIDGLEVGLIPDTYTGEQAYTNAMMNIKNILGYDPELSPVVRFYEAYSNEGTMLADADLGMAIEEVLIGGIDVIREQAYVMKIGDDFRVAVASIEDAEAVLQIAQDNFVSEESTFAVHLVQKEYNSLVYTPEITQIYTDVDTSRSFVAAVPDQAYVPGQPLFSANEDVYIEDDAVFDPYYDGETKGVLFSESVIVATSYVDPSEIMSVDAAAAEITKENEEPKIYIVESGDCPSTIADDHDMSLSDLYAMNEGLEENASRMSIGQELVVMVPEPELSVATYEEVVYVESISRGSTYVENPDKYAGHTATLYAGYDGELEVTATLTKVNGREVERVITNETVLLEPDDRIIEKGTKLLPAKGALGTFIPPLADYYVSSNFGYRWGGFHYGVDMAAATGTTIRSSDGGVVTFAGWNGNYGYLVIVDHGDGVTSRYAHMSKISVSVNQYVSQYEKLGEVGSTGRSTGPHLHFEIRFDGVAVDPLTYLEYE